MCKYGAKMPAAALKGDMTIYYATREIYTENATVMGLLCASTCVTAMITFTFEAKLRSENPLGAQAHMARHRMGARGNATSFPLPWGGLLGSLRAADDAANVLDLPRTGDELVGIVSVLLTTSGGDDPASMARFVHQAWVRRAVFVKLNEGVCRRQHRAYAGIDMDRVRRKAQTLPDNGGAS